MNAPTTSCSGHGSRNAATVFAILTAAAMFPLIVVGAGVTSRDAGMAYPDGFLSDGYFWNPPGWWSQYETRWEHGHRLLGRVVGLLAIGSAWLNWSRGNWRRRLSLATLAVTIVQGLLGMFRVDQVSTTLAFFHGIFGQACFCVAGAAALVATQAWAQRRGQRTIRGAALLQSLCFAGVGAVFLQLVSGAAARHFALESLVILHVLGALVVVLLNGWICLWVMGEQGAATPAGFLARVIGAATVLQLFIGGLTLLVTFIAPTRFTPTLFWLIPTIHVALGAVILSSCIMLGMCARRMLQVGESRVSAVRGPRSATTGLS